MGDYRRHGVGVVRSDYSFSDRWSLIKHEAAHHAGFSTEAEANRLMYCDIGPPSPEEEDDDVQCDGCGNEGGNS